MTSGGRRSTPVGAAMRGGVSTLHPQRVPQVAPEAVGSILRSDRVFRFAALAGVAWLAIYALLTWVTQDSPTQARFVGNVVYLGPLLTASLTGCLAAKRRWRANRTGRAWLMFALANVMWLTGELIWTGYSYATASEVPYPSAADVFYIANYFFIVPGLFFAFGQGHRSRLTRAALDMTLVALGLGILGWHVLVAPLLEDVDGLEELVSAVYPLCDVAMVVCLLSLGLSGHRRLPASVHLVGWSYLIMAAADCGYMYGTIADTYGDSSWLNLGFEASAVVLTLGGLVAMRRAEPDAVSTHFGRDLTIIPLLVAGGCAASVVALEHLKAGEPFGSLSVAGVIVAGLLIRQHLVARDRTRLARQLHDALQEQERLAVTDPLTGLYNRRFLQKSLDIEVARARRSGHPLSLVTLDLDHFKRINDECGHPFGDAVLVEVSARLRAAARAGDVVARQGGEEFAWLLPEADETIAVELAERLRAALSDSAVVVYGARPAWITGSIGVATARGEVDALLLIRDADRAMYQAKASGRDRVIRSSSGTAA